MRPRARIVITLPMSWRSDRCAFKPRRADGDFNCSPARIHRPCLECRSIVASTAAPLQKGDGFIKNDDFFETRILKSKNSFFFAYPNTRPKPRYDSTPNDKNSDSRNKPANNSFSQLLHMLSPDDR